MHADRDALPEEGDPVFYELNKDPYVTGSHRTPARHELPPLEPMMPWRDDTHGQTGLHTLTWESECGGNFYYKGSPICVVEGLGQEWDVVAGGQRLESYETTAAALVAAETWVLDRLAAMGVFDAYNARNERKWDGR